MDKKTGKVKAVTGWATGDRDLEAKGRAEEHADADDEITEEDVAEEREGVRRDHGDDGHGELSD